MSDLGVTLFPGALDTTTQQPNDKTPSSTTSSVHAQHHNNISDAILAIETTLGINPQDSFSDVATRFAHAVFANTDISQVIQPTSDVSAMTFRLHSNTSVANFLRFENSAGSPLAYITHQGAFDGSAFLIGGIQISSSDLSDGPFASLDSPNFTGTPTAPNPDLGDDSTQLATTHWVSEQNYVDADTFAVDLTPYAPKHSPTFTGTPLAPTPSPNDDSTKIATTAFVQDEIDSAISDGSPLYTIAATVAGLGTPAAGKAGMLRVGSTPFDFMMVVYDATYAKWIGPTIQSSHRQDPQIAAAFDNQPSIQTALPTTYSTYMSYMLTTPWQIWDTAGMTREN